MIIPSNVIVLDTLSIEGAYDRNHNLPLVKNLTIPNSVIAIDQDAIECTNITELTIPSSVKYIGIRALSDNEDLESVIIEEGCTHMDMFVFEGCKSLKTAYLPSTIKKYLIIGQTRIHSGKSKSK